MPARELENADSFGLRVIGATQDSQYSTHFLPCENDKENKSRSKRKKRTTIWENRETKKEKKRERKKKKKKKSFNLTRSQRKHRLLI